MTGRLNIFSGPEGRKVFIEFRRVLWLLAERRGERPYDTWAAMRATAAQYYQADPESYQNFQAAQGAVDRRYCAAEGIQDVQAYSERNARQQLKASFREALRGLRAEPWRKTWPGMLDA